MMVPEKIFIIPGFAVWEFEKKTERHLEYVLLENTTKNMADIRFKLRDQFKKETGKIANSHLREYADWLELRLMRDPKEIEVDYLFGILENAAKMMDTASVQIKKVLNK